jgi:NTP pyrophosphatase (non-canonical NTP hydrolase)
LKEDGRRTLEQRKRSAAQRVEEIAQAIERTGAQFGETEPRLADVASRLATTVGNLATRLREGSIDELVDDTRALARRNPGLLVAGFLLARFVKASSRRAPTLTEEVDEMAEVDADDEVIV